MFQLPTMRVFSDFDGTISRQDSLSYLLNEFGGARWKVLEAQLIAGELSERDAVNEAFREFPLSVAEASRWVLNHVSLDPSFATFYRWLETKQVPLTILSGGFVQFIRPLLAREGLQNLRLIANSATDVPGGWIIRSASYRRECEQFHHCKCSSLTLEQSQNVETTVYVGDGNTDFCPVSKSDVIFAKKSLARFCVSNGLSFNPFNDFRDVRLHLEALMTRQAA